jgi:hypothetical protein
MPIFRASGSFSTATASPGKQFTTDPVLGSFRPVKITTLTVVASSVPSEATIAHIGGIGFACERGGSVQTQGSMAARLADNASTASVRAGKSATLAFRSSGSSSGSVNTGGTIAIESDGFTPSVTTTGTSTVYWWAVGGDVSDAEIIAVPLTATGTQDISHSLGVVPDLALAMLPSGTTTSDQPNADVNMIWSIGMQERVGGTRGYVSLRVVAGSDPTQHFIDQRTDRMFRAITGASSATMDFDVTTWGSSSITLTHNVTPSAGMYVYLLLVKGGSWKAQEFAYASSPQDVTIESGKTPKWALVQSIGRPATSAIIDGDITYSLGVVNPEQQQAQFNSSADNAGTTATDKAYRASALYLGTINAPATAVAEASATFASGKTTYTWATADAGNRSFLQFTLSEAASDPVTGTVGATAPTATAIASDEGTGVSGTAAATAPQGTASASGFAYDVHTPIGGVVLSGEAQEAVTGSASPAASQATASASGAPVGSGTAGATSPDATASASGTPSITGSGSATAPQGTGAGSGTPEITGSAGVTAPQATVSAQQELGDITGTVAATAPQATTDGAGTSQVAGSAASTAPQAAGASIGTPAVSGDAASTASPAGASALQEIGTVTGDAQATAPQATAGASGTPDIAGTADASGQAAAGAGVVTGGVAGTGTAPSVAAEDGGSVTGTAAASAPAGTASGAGTSTVTGSAAGTAPAGAAFTVQIPEGDASVDWMLLQVAPRSRDVIGDREFMMPTRSVQLGETKRIGVQWSKALQAHSATIVTSTWEAPASLGLNGEQASLLRATVLVSPTVAGDFDVVNQITTTDGQTLRQEMTITVVS